VLYVMHVMHAHATEPVWGKGEEEIVLFAGKWEWVCGYRCRCASGDHA
jgi:hypothetical protein